MKIFVDIDGTICKNTSNTNYSNAKPIMKNITLINKLYDDGHEITYWSARGTVTGINWEKVTKNQFHEWGVKYHFLSLGEKPVFDLLVDDKVLNVNQIDSIYEMLKTIKDNE